MRFTLLALFFSKLLFWVPSAMAVETLPLWTYHAFPPFIIDQEKREGLTYDLASYLSARSNGAYDFTVEVLPRVRLDELLAAGLPGVVAWSNPAWFGDKEQKKYLWSDSLNEDSASIISPVSAPVEFSDASSLLGLSLAAVRGYKYVGIDDVVAAGGISRIDVESEAQLVLLVANNRADVGAVPHLAANYYVRELGLEDKIYFSKKPHSSFRRYFLIQPELKKVQHFLNEVIASVADDSTWQRMLSQYLLENTAEAALKSVPLAAIDALLKD